MYLLTTNIYIYWIIMWQCSWYLSLFSPLPSICCGQAAHGDLERGHGRASWRRHLTAAAWRAASHRPLCDRVRRNSLGTRYLNQGASFNSWSRNVCLCCCVSACRRWTPPLWGSSLTWWWRTPGVMSSWTHWHPGALSRWERTEMKKAK